MPFAWRASTQRGVRKLADVRHAGLKVCKILILLCADAGHRATTCTETRK
jgi:hypothetical protein